jgi:hypothetical protein
MSYLLEREGAAFLAGDTTSGGGARFGERLGYPPTMGPP